MLLGDHVAAAAAAEEVAQTPLELAAGAAFAARSLARCAELAQMDTTLTPAERTAKSADYDERAIAMLRQALSKGFRDAAGVNRATGLRGFAAVQTCNRC